MTDKDLDEFRKEVGGKFYVPLNHEMFGRIADAPVWEREIFVWNHKRLHGCESRDGLGVETEFGAQISKSTAVRTRCNCG